MPDGAIAQPLDAVPPQPSLTASAPDPETPAVSEGLPTALEVADAVLSLSARRSTSAVLLDPGPQGHELLLTRASGCLAAGWIPGELADAVVARIALLARIDLAGEGTLLGRLELTVFEREIELIVMVRRRPSGLAIELQRIPARRQAAPTAGERGLDMPGPGARIGRYRLLERIGSGGLGVVFRGEHVTMQKPVAIKILHPELSRQPEPVARFLNEARASSRVQHPGLVAATDCGSTVEGHTYLVMELVDWPTLSELLVAAGPLPPARAVTVAASLAEALDAAHEAGIIHRDVKPANVFVGPGDRVKIADFGAAKLARAAPGALSDTLRGIWYGTPLYMSPEHAAGTSTDRRTDIYALGCTFFEMLTGHVPYDGMSAFEVVSRHEADPIPQARSPSGALPPIFGTTLRRALAKRPDERYQNVRELLVDLERCAAALQRKGWRAWLPT